MAPTMETSTRRGGSKRGWRALGLCLAGFAPAGEATASGLAPVPVSTPPAPRAGLATSTPRFAWTPISGDSKDCAQYNLLLTTPNWDLTAIHHLVNEPFFVPSCWDGLVGSPGHRIEYDWRLSACHGGGGRSAWSTESRLAVTALAR